MNNLEIRCPERGRKRIVAISLFVIPRFGNKIPREGTETA